MQNTFTPNLRRYTFGAKLGSTAYKFKQWHHFGSFYHPSNSPTTALNDLNDWLRFIRRKFPCAKIIPGGDFNCPDIDWHTGTLTDCHVSLFLRESLMELPTTTSCYFSNKTKQLNRPMFHVSHWSRAIIPILSCPMWPWSFLH